MAATADRNRRAGGGLGDQRSGCGRHHGEVVDRRCRHAADDLVGPARDVGRPIRESGGRVGERTAVVGNNYGPARAQVAYIYQHGSTGWSKKPAATLHDPLTTGNHLEFGIAVAISGNTIVVAGSSTAGQVAYVFVKGSTGWPKKPTAALKAPAGQTQAAFGTAVAVSGKTIVVTARAANNYAGVADIYEESGTRWPTAPNTTLSDPAATAHDMFGDAAALSGGILVIGASGTNSSSGAAYIYVGGTPGWPTTPTATLPNPAGTTNDVFGSAVAASGSVVVVGSNAFASVDAYIYVQGTSGWPTTPTVTLPDPAPSSEDFFGGAVGVSGSTVVIGAHGENSFRGTAYMYIEGASTWPTSPTVTLSDPANTSYDYFGGSVSVSGTTAMVGADGTKNFAGAVYVYQA